MRPHIRRVKCIIRFFIVCTAALLVLSIFILKRTSIIQMTEIEKCPACFGVSFCPSVNTGHIELHPFSSWFNIKNVFYANSPYGTLVLKKLGHDWELAALDEHICHIMGYYSSNDCVISDLVWRLEDVKAAIFDVVKSNKTIRSDFTFCPAFDSSQLDEIIDRVNAKTKGVGYKTLLTNILTMLMINPEPVILQAFPAIDGWPFPRHLGSCGRITVQKYAGTRISRLVSAPWHSRANVAVQLLQAARQLTFQDPRYALYITDLSIDNVVIDKDGKVTIIDLGNMVIVDKYPPISGRVEGWSDMHTSDSVDGCDTCFVFSTEDLCRHKTSDHNYYAVCQFLAQHSWLAEPPADVVRSYPQLESLLRECLSPEMDNGRYIAVRHLIPILANLTAIM